MLCQYSENCDVVPPGFATHQSHLHRLLYESQQDSQQENDITYQGIVEVLDGIYLEFFQGALSKKMTFGMVSPSQTRSAGGLAVAIVIATNGLGNATGLGLSGVGGTVGTAWVEVVAASEGSAPPSVGDGCREIDDAEAFGDSGLGGGMGPLTVAMGSIAIIYMDRRMGHQMHST
jgi:hypothetical protein